MSGCYIVDDDYMLANRWLLDDVEDVAKVAQIPLDEFYFFRDFVQFLDGGVAVEGGDRAHALLQQLTGNFGMLTTKRTRS